MRDSKHLSLAEAQKTSKLQEFAAQQEGIGYGPVLVSDFDELVKISVTEPRRQDQTSGSRVPGGSTEKKTPSRT